MPFYQPIRYQNSPDGKSNSAGVNNNISNLIQSFFGEELAFVITYTKSSATSLDAQVEVYTIDHINERLCLRETLKASSFSSDRIAVAKGQNPENEDYIPGVSRL